MHGHRSASRKAAAGHTPALAAAGRAVHARVSDLRCGDLEADIAAVVGKHLSAVQLSGAESAQDVRDADVAIRRQEMRLGIAPGSVRLIPRLDSAAGLLALPAMLTAIDRHGALLLDVDGLSDDLGLPDSEGAEAADAVLEHAMWDIAVAARAAALPWLVGALTVGPRSAPGSPRGRGNSARPGPASPRRRRSAASTPCSRPRRRRSPPPAERWRGGSACAAAAGSRAPIDASCDARSPCSRGSTRSSAASGRGSRST